MLDARARRPGSIRTRELADFVHREPEHAGSRGWSIKREQPTRRRSAIEPYFADVIRITQTEIFVYGQDLQLVAQHELRPRRCR